MAISWDTGTKLGVIALSNLWGIWEGRLSSLNRKRAEVQHGQVSDQGSLAWIFVAVFVGIFIACFFAFSGKGALCPLEAWVALGLVLMGMGFAIRFTAMRALARHFTHRVTILSGHSLIRTGIYRFIRHPAYLGQLMMMVGIGTALANIYAIVLAPLPVVAALFIRIRIEERALAQHFGPEYKAYCEATSRLLPFVW